MPQETNHLNQSSIRQRLLDCGKLLGDEEELNEEDFDVDEIDVELDDDVDDVTEDDLVLDAENDDVDDEEQDL